MQFTRTSLFPLFVSLAFTAPLPCQAVSQLAQSTPPTKKSSFQPSVDVSVGAFGQLTYARTPMTADVEPNATFVTERVQSSSPSVGIAATLHQSFRQFVGYNVNMGYTRFTQSYSEAEGSIPKSSQSSLGTASYSQGSLKTNQYELTVAYAIEGPGHKRLRTFAQLGGGGLFYVPSGAPQAKQQTRPAMVFGVGMDYRFSKHLGLRAEYKGLFYKGPDFAIDTYGFPKQRLFTVTNMPTVSLVYRFK